MRLALLVLLAAAALGARPAAAQQVPEPGTRVRLTVPISVAPGRVIGTLTSVDSSRFVVNVASTGEQLEIPHALVRRIEVSQGHITPQDATRRGAIQGAQAGAILLGGTMGALGVVSILFFDDSEVGADKGAVLKYTAIATGGGAAVGALAGGAFGGRATERWKEVRMGSLALRWDGGRTVGLAISF